MLQVIEALQRGAAHESLVCCAAYLLGEYGRQVQQVPLRDQFALLQERFVTVSSEAKVRTPCQLLLHTELAATTSCLLLYLCMLCTGVHHTEVLILQGLYLQASLATAYWHARVCKGMLLVNCTCTLVRL